MSIFSQLIRGSQRPKEVHFVYATKATSDLDQQKILFLPRLMDLVAAEADPNVSLSLFLTGTGDEGVIEHGKLPNRTFGRRITETDLVKAIDGYKQNVFGAEHDRKNTVCYVCGPPNMTDEFGECACDIMSGGEANFFQSLSCESKKACLRTGCYKRSGGDGSFEVAF